MSARESRSDTNDREPIPIYGRAMDGVIRAPWPVLGPAYVERLNGSIRGECLDYLIIIGKAGSNPYLTPVVCAAHTAGDDSR